MQLFPKWTNNFPGIFLIAVFLLIFSLSSFLWYYGSPYYTDVGYAPSQPVMKVLISSPGNSTEDSDALTMYKDPNMQDVWWIELDLPGGEYEYEYFYMNTII